MDNELVSVIIPCYNGEKYLRDCLNALLYQTYNNIEVIIVNDGSTDNSEKIIDEYCVKFLEKNLQLKKINQPNKGQAEAVNNALKYAKGDYLIWQDCDDYYEKNAIELMVDYLKKNKEIDFVRGKSIFRDEKNLNNIIAKKESKYPNETNIFDFYVLETDSYTYPGIFMTRMNYFDKCIKNRSIYGSRGGQNWQLILPLAYKGKCGYLNEFVYNYRICKNSHSHSVQKLKEQLERCDVHKDILEHVFLDIGMEKKDLKKYLKLVKKKYILKKFRILLSKIKQIIKRNLL